MARSICDVIRQLMTGDHRRQTTRQVVERELSVDLGRRKNWLKMDIFASVIIALCGTLPVSRSTVISGYMETRDFLSDRVTCFHGTRNVVATEKFPSVLGCAGRCVLESRCASLHYQHHSGTCVLCTSHLVKTTYAFPQTGTIHLARIAGNCTQETGYNFFPFYHSCLKIHDQSARSWNDARAQCQAEGGDLLGLESFQKVKDLDINLNANGLTSAFSVGARDDGVAWRWPDGSSVDATVWKAGQELVTDKHCSAMIKYDLLHRVHCTTELLPFICEISV